MSHSDNFILWENDSYSVYTLSNPHIPYFEGPHIYLIPKRVIPNAWADAELAGQTFKLAAKVCAIMEGLKLSPWFNLQANGNWGLLPGKKPYFHIHIYGRNKTDTWAKPIVLPEAPGTFQNEPMPEEDRARLSQALATQLNLKLAKQRRDKYI